MNDIKKELLAIARADQILENEMMSRHTTFKVGGPADLMVFPESEQQIAQSMHLAGEYAFPIIVIGNGSNLVVRDGGIRGLVVVLGERYARMKAEEGIVEACAGASLSRVASFAQSNGLAGLEFASGIPGTLGGGCAMNAGAYGGSLSDVLIEAKVLIGDVICTLRGGEMCFGYRTSRPLREGGVVLSARFALTPDSPQAIADRMRELNARRREKQPLNYPSAGSVFKRPEGYFAGALIEKAGLKGKSVGGAQVSSKHAGFIVNTGNATASDILELISIVQDEVARQFGVQLETEVRILGED